MGSEVEAPIHILLVSFPGQGHVNPLLRLGKCLAAKGVSVIFTTTENAGKGMRAVNNITDKLATPIGNGSLTFEFFDDGLPEDARPLDHIQELERGKVVKWSPQEEVLAHPSTACFMTHCGWNSSMEALALGVPVLTFPSFGDQVTNAKILVDVFEVGIKLGCHGIGNNELVTRDEVKKYLLEITKGEKAERLKKNAIKWKKAAEDAVAVGGSSDRHLDAFIQDIKYRVTKV